MFEDVKLLLGLATDEKDSLLKVLLAQATAEAKAYTNNTNMAVLSPAITQMVVYKYNRLGTEGLNNESYSGESYNYAAEYPAAVMSLLKSCRRIKTI